MSDNTRSDGATSQAPSTSMRGDIQRKWGKFSEDEIAALKNKDDLVALIQGKYSLDKAQAQRDVDAFANGRQL